MSRMMICRDWNKCKKVSCIQRYPYQSTDRILYRGCGKITELRFLPKDVQLRIVLKSLL